jgi:hypothetical protein
MSTIRVQRAERRSESLGGGAYLTGRIYADFIVDGEPLSAYVQRRYRDMISCLGWGPPAAQGTVVAELLLEAPSEHPEGRVSIYVCPECGDFYCGAFTARIERNGAWVVWRDFGYENTYDPDPSEPSPTWEALGPFQFEWAEYEATIRAGHGMDGFDARGILPPEVEEE